MPGGEGACGTLPMNTEHNLIPLYRVLFFLGNVMTDIIEELHTQFIRADWKGAHKSLMRQVHDDLSVGPCVIGRACHGRKVSTALVRFEGGTGQLSVRQNKGIFARLCKPVHLFQKVIAYLMAKASWTGMDENRDLAFKKVIGLGLLRVVDFINHLDFHKMIPWTQSPQLVLASFDGSFTQNRGISSLHGPVVLCSLEVLSRTIALFYCPRGALDGHLGLLVFGKVNRSCGANPAWDVFK